MHTLQYCMHHHRILHSFFLLINATTCRNLENNVIWLVGVVQGDTEAASHKLAVSAIANDLRQLIDMANAQIFGIDVNGNVNEWKNKTKNHRVFAEGGLDLSAGFHLHCAQASATSVGCHGQRLAEHQEL